MRDPLRQRLTARMLAKAKPRSDITAGTGVGFVPLEGQSSGHVLEGQSSGHVLEGQSSGHVL